MKVLLVNTNRMKPAIAPIGLDYLADALIQAGHEPKLLDLCFSEDIEGDMEHAVKGFGPDVIGVTIRNTDDCYFSGGAFFLPEICDIVAKLRKLTEAPIVLGGVGFSVMPEAVMDFCEQRIRRESSPADLKLFGVWGDGEAAFVQLLSAFKGSIDFDQVPGLIYRRNGTFQRNPGGNESEMNLRRTRRFVDNAHYFRVGGQAGFETKRGCDMKCVYCADPVSKGRRVRLRSPKLVVDELKALLAQGIDYFHTCDCEFNIPGDHAKDVCRAIIDARLGERIRWYAYCSVTPFDSEMADLMKRAGCEGIDFGADSGSDEMLSRLGRHFRSEDLVRTAKLCHDYGITFMYDLLIGSPGETRATARESIELMRRIDADCVGLSMGVRIYEGTRMAEFVRAEGDMVCNPDIYGHKTDNPSLIKPVFYISPEFGAQIACILREMVAGDTRFFLPSTEQIESNYNYSDNTILVRAIAEGARGAYWDILRRLQG